MKKKLISAALALLFLLPAGCGQAASSQSMAPSAASVISEKSSSTKSAWVSASWTFTDAKKRKMTIPAAPKRVAALYGSFAEAWTLAGGTLAGTTEDAVSERKMSLGSAVKVVGTVKEPNLEQVLALQPDFVILSSEISAQVKLDASLTKLNIPHAYFSVKTYQQYLEMMKGFTALTGRPDLYEKNGASVQKQITEILAKVPKDKKPTALLIRAFSSGAKAKNSDDLAGAVLKDLGADNIADRKKSLLEDLSMEEIVKEDPDYIFVTVMGESEEKALAALKKGIQANPAWAQLSAVKNNRYVVLPKELFHYKPNAKWGESYAYLAKLLYPDVFK